VSLGRIRARPSCTARAWPVLTALARRACAAHSTSIGAARAAQLGRHARRVRRRCTTTQWRHPIGAQEMSEETGGSPARGWRRGMTATGERRGGTATDERQWLRTAAVGTADWSGWQLGRDGGARGEASGERCRGEACGGGREGLSGDGCGAVETAFKPQRAGLDSAAHGSQSRLGAARHCH
jgi:hypothetical protein